MQGMNQRSGTGVTAPIPFGAPGVNQATHNTGNGNAKKLTLVPNVPELIALKFPTGKIVQSMYGDEKQVFFSLTDGRSAFLSLGIAQKIYDLQLSNREQFYICKKAPAQGNGYIDVWLTPEGERSRAQAAAVEQPTLLERQLVASIREVKERIVNDTNATSATIEPPAAPTWSARLVGQTNALVDAFAACLEHADKEHGNRVKPEDVRSLLQTVYIAMSKNGGSHNA